MPFNCSWFYISVATLQKMNVMEAVVCAGKLMECDEENDSSASVLVKTISDSDACK